eukprot:COSAG02_NODE_3986_length_5948_cov_1.918619_9_plen_70_part_00
MIGLLCFGCVCSTWTYGVTDDRGGVLPKYQSQAYRRGETVNEASLCLILLLARQSEQRYAVDYFAQTHS